MWNLTILSSDTLQKCWPRRCNLWPIRHSWRLATGLPTLGLMHMDEWLKESEQPLITKPLLSAKHEYRSANTSFRTVTTHPLKLFRIIGSVHHTTLISRHTWFPPEQACANKGQFEAALSPQPHMLGWKMCLNISPSAKLRYSKHIFSWQKMSKSDKKDIKKYLKFQNDRNDQKRPIKYTFLYPAGHEHSLCI
jgi:hypothetical protein